MAERDPTPDRVPHPVPEPVTEPDPVPGRDPAMGRYMALHLVRLACIFVVMFGLLIQEGRIEGPALLGFALLVGGALGFFFLPHTLAKRWKSREG